MEQTMQEVKEWTEKSGLTIIETNGLTVEKITNFISNIKEKTIDDLYDILGQILSYNTFLKSSRSSLNVQLIYYQNKFDSKIHKMSPEVRAMEGNKYLTKEECLAKTISMDSELMQLADVLESIRLKYNKIKDMPHQIDRISDYIKEVIHRKTSNV